MSGAAGLIQTLHAHLSAEGFRPTLDADGALSFRSEGLSFHVLVDEEDLDYIGIVLPDLMVVGPNEGDEVRVLWLLNRLNRTSRAVKLVIDESGQEVLAVFQAVLPQSSAAFGAAALGEIVLRGIDALLLARNRLG